jgi:hypothetical protein
VSRPERTGGGDKELNIMSTMKWLGRLLVGGALLAVPVSSTLQAQVEGVVTYDQELVRLAEEIPGFGGLWRDGRGQTHAWLVDLSWSLEVQRLDPAGVEVHQGAYDVRELAGWKAELRPLLGREGAISLDLDEAGNRLRLQVERGAEDGFEEALRAVRVPREAVILAAGEPFDTFESLTDRIRPVPGGVRIRNAGGGPCTHGFNVVRNGIRGFVTNSHCSATRSLVEGTVFFQRDNLALFDRVGVETVDPPFFTGGSCPSGRRCRFSDAIFVDYDTDSYSAGLKIAHPAFCSIGVGTLLVHPALPRLPITGSTFAVSGTAVAKVGVSTGCTFGAIQSTCADVNVNKTNITMICQEVVAGVGAPGDSGSPVFIHGGDRATIAGLLWGGSTSAGIYSFSSWPLLSTELGFPALVP